MDRLTKIEKYLSKAYSYEEKMRFYLQKTINIAIEGKGFTDEEKHKFGISMATGAEEIVTYDNRGEFLEISVEQLNEMSSDDIREAFDID